MITSAAAEAPAAVLRVAIDACRRDQLDDFAKLLWRGHGAGEISEDEAEALSAAIEARRDRNPRTAPAGSPALAARFAARRRVTSPDRQASRDRRRTLAGSAMPDHLRAHFTEGERAAMAIVAGQVKSGGLCDLPLDQIAALAGVGRTTARNALNEARRLGLVRITYRPRRGQKSLTNIVRVVSPEWLAWLKRGPPPRYGIGSKTSAGTGISSPTKNREGRKAFDAEGMSARSSPFEGRPGRCREAAHAC